MRALIVDDERLARAELRRLLTRHPSVEIVGEAANATDARRALFDLEPDLLFLDVQMPGETGFDLLTSLDAVPLVVFTTAYDEHALRAFEVNALDYLVKPIDPERLGRTVARIEAVGDARDDVDDEDVHVATADARRGATLTEQHRVFVTEGERAWLVRLADVRIFEAEHNRTRVHFAGETPLIQRTLGELEQKLDSRAFFRANRHQIINLRAVRSIHRWFGGRLMVNVEGGHEVTLSRRRSRLFRELMSM